MGVDHRSHLLACLLTLCLCAVSMAHVPVQGGENDHLDHALHIDDPEKSWVVYDTLPPGVGVKYYRFDLEEGDELRLGLFVPPDHSTALPTLVVMGPEVVGSGTVPADVEVPPDTGVIVVESRAPARPEYEPFTPSALSQVASYSMDVTIPGTYYAAVAGEGGNFGLSVGFKEEFSVVEWLTVPISVVGVYLWEGQSPLLVFGPLVLVLFIGAVTLARAQRRLDIAGFLAVVAGLLYIGGAAMILLQMGLALIQTGWSTTALFTLLFVLAPLALGAVAVRAGMKREQKGFFLKMTGVGLLGLLLWAGLVLGPVLALVAALTGTFRRGG